MRQNRCPQHHADADRGPAQISPGHSLGLPIKLEVFVPSGQLSPEGTILVDFLITNVGSGSIRLPSALSLRQPSGVNRPYDLLTLWLTSDAIRKQYAKDERTGRLFEIETVATSAELYADSDEADTFALLPPSASMLVHASSPQLNPGGYSITAHAWLERVSSHAELVGTADSETVRKSFTNFELHQLVQAAPLRTHTGNSTPSDPTNLMFLGTRNQLAAAFGEAGWFEADDLGVKSALKVAQATLRQSGYSGAPVSTLLVEGRPPDLVFQKSLDTFAKRHHLRIWKLPKPYNGQDV